MVHELLSDLKRLEILGRVFRSHKYLVTELLHLVCCRGDSSKSAGRQVQKRRKPPKRFFGNVCDVALNITSAMVRDKNKAPNTGTKCQEIN